MCNTVIRVMWVMCNTGLDHEINTMLWDLIFGYFYSVNCIKEINLQGLQLLPIFYNVILNKKHQI